MENDSKIEMTVCRIAIDEWQRQQFPDANLAGAGMHLVQEINEACEELADCFFMAVQCERLGGAKMGLPETVWEMMEGLGALPERVIMAKLEKNKQRKWPTTPDADGVYHHED